MPTSTAKNSQESGLRIKLGVIIIFRAKVSKCTKEVSTENFVTLTHGFLLKITWRNAVEEIAQQLPGIGKRTALRYGLASY